MDTTPAGQPARITSGITTSGGTMDSSDDADRPEQRRSADGATPAMFARTERTVQETVQGHISQPAEATVADTDAPADEVIALSVETGDDGALAVVHVTGEVDMLTTPLLRSTLIQQLDNGARRLIVDLREVTFLGSSGLGVLVEALKAARRHDATLQLVCTSRAVTRPLAVTGLSQVFDVRDDLPDEAGLSPAG